MPTKTMLLSYKRLDYQSFAMHNERTDSIEYTFHYELTYKKKTWLGLSIKVVTANCSWNAGNREVIESQLDSKIGKWI